MLNDQDIQSIITLLEDPDEEVQSSLFGWFHARGEEAVFPLESIGKNTRERDSGGIARMIELLRARFNYDALQKWVENPHDNLLRGLYLIQKVISPDADYDRMDTQLTDMVSSVCVELSDDQTDMERVKVFNHLFFHRLGFKAVDPMFEQPQKTFIHLALSAREGSPIALGIIYLLVAFHSGVPIRGRVFKGGFLPAVIDRSGEVIFYVNVYRNGQLFDHTQLSSFVKDMNANIPEDSFREATVTDLAKVYAETLDYSFTVKDGEASRKAAVDVRNVLGLFGSPDLLTIEIDEDEDEE